ncbi:unnamed protein product [Darwinula stevensoni]|uniref:Uncharacterized protein n=1 Tax=Darwinula stevensoni TaxID=69355 RepID=A0A7R9ACB2_9CRUS|nr:unnamed protein product [Darwinula stevensoni]CAG0900156.1 unnamed protein product [Darwinula stevensoni]
MIAELFGEAWDKDKACNEMCDHCDKDMNCKEMDITNHFLSLCTVFEVAASRKIRLTGAKLVGAWMGSPGNGLKVNLPHPPLSTRGMCERVIAHLLIEGYLQEDFHFTPYNTISYILPGGMRNGTTEGERPERKPGNGQQVCYHYTSEPCLLDAILIRHKMDKTTLVDQYLQ